MALTLPTLGFCGFGPGTRAPGTYSIRGIIGSIQTYP
jgi:hypothetical protein